MEHEYADQPAKQFWWLESVQNAMRARRIPTTLKLLDLVIFSQEGFGQQGLPLFAEQERQYALLYKVNLLLSFGRTHEALAWLCLEQSLHPDNSSAAAKREELLQKLPDSEGRKSTVASAVRFSLGWEGVAGMEDVKLRFERDVIMPLKQPEIYAAYGLLPPNGILLWGPPGCGKTFLASKLAERLEFSFLEIRPSDIANIYIHGTVQKIAEAFDEAEANAPAVVFIDELDAIAPNRAGLYHSYAAEVNQLLIRLNNCAERGITVIGATNTPDRIDPAIKRPGRFDVLIYVPPPDIAAREQLFSIHLEGRMLDPEIDISDLATRTSGYTCSDIKHLCEEAARKAVSTLTPISHQHLLRAIELNLPSVSGEELLQYEELRAKER